MALINKIRERSGIAVAVIAVALLLFIIGGDIFSSSQNGGGLFGGSDSKIGEVAGKSIDQKEFIEQLEIARANYEAQSGRAATQQEIQQLRDQVWEQFIADNAYQKELDELGITVTSEELSEMIQGSKNMHPYVKQYFSNPQTGQFDEALRANFITQAANNTLPAEQKAGWDTFKRQLKDFRIREKYENLLSASNYITQAEAKKEYVAQTEQVDTKYLFVPFYSVNDSSIKVTDNQLSDYLKAHKDEFRGYDSRTFDYVVFQVTPSKEDSAAMMTDLRDLAKGMAAAPDAQAYASANSDIKYRNLRGAAELPAEVVVSLNSAIVGQTVGPFKEGQAYSIYKYLGREADKDSVRASHILVADKVTADNLLAQIKAGADFAALAKANSTDTGSKEKGGDLGYFGRGMMVAPFEAAAFANSGLVAEPVQSQFGYHIIKVTGKKATDKYKVATISRVLAAGESTRNVAYQQAEEFRVSAKNAEDLKAKVKANEKLALLTATRVMPTASSFNSIQEGREVINWSFSDKTSTGDVSDRVFEINDNFIIAAVTGASDKENVKVEDFKDEITAKVRNKVKAEQITAKLAKTKATDPLESIASGYGAGALVEAATGITMATGMLNSAGVDAVAVGKAFGLPKGKRTEPFVGDNGVFIMEVTNKVQAPEIADYSQYKEQIKQKTMNYGASLANQAIRDHAEIKDYRYKFF
jgi:peptidyl-prolyl cis-trans isomerase D